MPPVTSEIGAWLALLSELIRLTAPPAGETEICEQGLAVLAKGLGAAGGVLLLRGRSTSSPAAVRGPVPTAELAAAAERAMANSDLIEEGGQPGRPARVALPLTGSSGTCGAVALDSPTEWGAWASTFARGAARTIAAALQSAEMLEEGRRQREQLVQRNLELEILRELSGTLQEHTTEKEMLQGALDLVLEKLGLASGWIFWGQSSRQELELAASRGITEQFVSQARESGVGECLCKDVFATGRLRMARNTLDCPRLPGLVCGSETMSHACIPLNFERGTLGVMNIANRPGRLFTRQELQFLETTGTQICLAVDKARTARAESRRNAEARALASLTRAIGGSLDQDRVLGAVGEYGRELLRADRCVIFLGDGTAHPVFAYLSGPPMEGLEVGAAADLATLGSRALVEAMRERRTLVVRDALHDPRVNPELARRWNIRSFILVPLVAHGRLQGLMSADRSRVSDWGTDDVEVAGVLAGQAALAIDNARLYEEAQEAFLRLQQAQYGMVRAERLAAVGTLASSLAHEIRNPLNSISLQLVLLSRRLKRLDDPVQTDVSALLESTRSEIARLDGLVEEFLSLSTIDRLVLSEARPNELVREVMSLMAPAARQKGVQVVEETHGEPLPLRLDREKMKQVLINLVRNAIEAMPEGGTLTVTTRGSPDAAVISVADTGAGIEPGLDIFDFFTTTKRGGTGLGLPIARRIVEAHGGNIGFESQPGHGATFRVTLRRPSGKGEPLQ